MNAWVQISGCRTYRKVTNIQDHFLGLTYRKLEALVQIIEMILGEEPAPWENPETARRLLRPLGIFKTGVLGLLKRDAAQRSTIHKFQQACRRSLANTSITAT